MNFSAHVLTLALTVLSISFVYAQKEIYCVDLGQNAFENCENFNIDIENKKLIILGEKHYMAQNSIIQVDLLIHLNMKFGVKYLLIEFGRAEAYLYNQYLQTGDEWYLNYTFGGCNGYQEFLSSMKKLYEYNSGLSSSNKIIIHGLDFEREPGLSASMYKLLSNHSDEVKVKRLINIIYNRLDTIGVERDTKDYIYFLREKISEISFPKDGSGKMINTIINNNSFVIDFSKRDINMALSFQSLDTLNQMYLGQFGVGHTMLNNKSGLVGILNNKENYSGKLLVINMHYVSGQNAKPYEGLSDCPIFLFNIDPNDKSFGKLAKREHWALILRDQKKYTQ